MVDLVESGGEVGHGEHERSEGEEDAAAADPSRLARAHLTSQIGNGQDEDEGGDVVGAHDQSAVGRRQFVAFLDGRDRHVDQTVDQ